MAERKRKTPKKAPITTRVTVGTPIRLEQPAGKRKPKPNPAVVVVQEINPVGGFAKFIKDYGVIGVAIGFAIASQAQVLIKSLMDNVITPAYTVLFNVASPEKAVLHMHFRDRTSILNWGLFLNQLINFIFVLAVIYALVKILGLDKLDKKDQEKKK